MLINIVFNGTYYNIDLNLNTEINIIKKDIFNKFFSNIFDNYDNFQLLFDGIIINDKLSNYNLKKNSNIHLIIKSNNKNINNKSIVEDYILSPLSPISSYSNSFENKNKFNFILNKIKCIENELNELKDYINSFN